MFHRRSLAQPALALALSALGCATGTGAPDGAPGSADSGGSAGIGFAGSAGSVSSAGTGTPNGGSDQAGAPSSGGGAIGAGAAGSNDGSSGAPGASGSSGSSGSGNTGPVTAGLPFTEDFESGMIAPTLWTAVAGQVPDPTDAKWSVVADDTGKGAQLDSDGTERFLVGGNGAWTDQKLELRVKVVSGSPEVDIAFRYHALKDYYYLEFADKHFKVRDRSGNNKDLLPTGDKPPLVVGTWYKITLQVKGTAVSGSLDDVVIVSGTFATMPVAAGGIAIGVGSGSGVVQFDDIHVTAP